MYYQSAQWLEAALMISLLLDAEKPDDMNLMDETRAAVSRS
jgi:hypothetical protein